MTADEHFARAVTAIEMAERDVSAHGSRAWSAIADVRLRMAEYVRGTPTAPAGPVLVPPADDQDSRR